MLDLYYLIHMLDLYYLFNFLLKTLSKSPNVYIQPTIPSSFKDFFSKKYTILLSKQQPSF